MAALDDHLPKLSGKDIEGYDTLTGEHMNNGVFRPNVSLEGGIRLVCWRSIDDEFDAD